MESGEGKEERQRGGEVESSEGREEMRPFCGIGVALGGRGGCSSQTHTVPLARSPT